MSSNQSLHGPPRSDRWRVRPQAEPDEPIVAELFSVERLEQHAQTLAAAQAVTNTPSRGHAVGPRIAENGHVLVDAYRVLARAIKDERAITPAAEWLVDNFPIVDEQLREIRDDLPPDYYRELPKLAEGHLAGYPRVLGLAWAYIAHTDSRFDPESLRRMVRAYQAVEPLTIGELWAIAISLRILLVENLRRLAEQIVRSRAARQTADEIAEGLLGLGADSPEVAAATLRRLSHAALPTAARVQLFQRLRDQDPAVTPALRWLEEMLAAQGTTAEEMVRIEHQRQATMNVTVRNVITSMRLISWFDWAEFVESVSLVDEVLGARTLFGEMDFATRDRYRHAVEEVARGSGLTEVDVARKAAAMASEARSADGVEPSLAARREDPGYYLISDGRLALERALNARVPLAGKLRRADVRAGARGYLATLALVTALILAVPLLLSGAGGAAGAAILLMAILALAPASDLAIALVNRAVTNVLGPRSLPRLALEDGVPSRLRTLVVVPMLLTGEADVEAQVGGLEVHYLGNREGDIRFALLSDWLDAPTEHLPGDDELLSAAVAAIDQLNERHGKAPGGGARFLLFHRKRSWNEAEGCWMGWERKRGKLHELNALLRGSTTTGILTTGRPSSIPPTDVRYVVTLDADTRLPRGAVGRLVGTIAHPLNQPAFDSQAGRVTQGYGVLQPRITSTLPTQDEASLFQRIYSGSAGIDPYASAVSDVYQDLFGEGSFTGKGIYDLDAFAAALADRVPENALLSHDLFEGVFARAGLVTDVELFDEFPSNYLVSAARQHRWARGDWQLLPWILGRARDASGRRSRSSIPGISRWKMVDNLRRTVSAPLTQATLVASWTLPSVSAGLWTAFVLASVIIPATLPVLAGLLPRRQGISKRSHLRAIGADIALAAAQVGLGLTFLAHQAWLMIDAILRTLVRLYVTRRNLLEWTTAAQAKASHDLDPAGFYRQMAGGVAIAVATAVLVFAVKPGAAWIAAPFVVLWLLSPLVALRVSLPPPESAAEQLSAADVGALRLTARRTWRFFETFVGPEDHALPPDNFQDDPTPVVAHRTSPTNIGMYLLATVTARDLGWIGTLEMVERLEATLATIGNLERFRGHLFNWYDTRDLHRLEPAYVSSVDSGNLAGHLLALSNACRQMIDQPLPVAAALAGIGDAIALTREAAGAIGDDRRSQTLTRRHLDDALELPAGAADGPVPATPEGWAARLDELSTHARTLSDVAAALTAERGDGADGELVTWAEAARLAVGSHVRDLALLQPPPPGPAFPTIAELSEPLVQEAGDGAPAAAMLVRRLQAIADRAQQLFREMDFSFLFDPTRKLFSIGFRVRDGTLDPSYYDLLASEARLASFLAIAKGDVAPDHWFRLGRALTPVGRGSALISWSGSMFEYLMPALVMRAPALSLLDHTYRLVVARQMSYAAELGVPWGISESAFNARDLEQTYQYSSFGVPGLGLKRGLSEDVVVAPYATALGAMIQPEAAVRNFARLRSAGAAGRYGFREALDYTARRLPEGASVAIVKSYMAHHQGMALVALGNVLNDRAMVERFHADPIVEATELLLQERMPRDVLVARPRAEEVKSAADVRDLVPPVLRRFTSPHDAIPRTHLLSNGRYAVMVTAAGSGYSRWGDVAVTRWREDVTRDSWGSYLFLRDMHTGAVWSAGHQPSGAEADSYEVTYSEDHAEFSRRDGSIATGLTIVVSAEHDAEIRRVSLTNLGSHDRQIELTSYAEIALAPQAADVAHPAFQNLFVQTEFVPDIGALLATRRPRSADEQPIWAAHVAAVEEETGGVIQYETDRARFLGRGRSVRSPVSVIDGRPLSNTVGAVLDPIFSLRCRVRLAPGATAHAIFSTVVAESREQVLDLADKYRESATFERAATLAWTQAQVQLHHLGIEADEAHLFQRLANRILYSDPSLRPSAGLLARNERGAPGLWAHGISGDLPIVMVRIDEAEDLDIVRQLLRAHEYWRLKLLDVDLVILNEHGATYAQDLHDSLETLVRTSQSILVHEGHPGHGGVYILRGDQLSTEDRTLLQAAARAVLLSRRGSLADQVIRLERPERIASARSAARFEADQERGGRAASGAGVLQRARWLRRWRARVRHHPRPGTVHPGALAERDRQRVVRVPGLRVRVGLHLVREQPREPAHPMVQRPRQRPGERGDLRPGRRQRRAVGSDGPADPLRGIDVRRPSRCRIQPVRAPARRHRARPRPVRPARRPPEGLGADHREPVRALQAPVRDRLRRVGAGHLARGQRPADRHGTGAGDAGAPRAQPVEHRIRRPGRLPRPRRAADGVDGRSDRVPRPQRRSGPARRPGPRIPAAGSRRRRHGSVRRPADQLRARQRSADPGPRAARRGGRGHGGGRPHPARANGRPRGDAARRGELLGRYPGHGPGADARPLDGHHAQPLAHLPDARLPAVGEDGVLPGRRRLRVPRPAPGRHRPGDLEARARPGASPAGRGTSVRRGRRPALVASAVGSGRPDPDLGRSPLAAVRGRSLPRGHGRHGGPRRDRPLPRGTGPAAGPGGRLLPAGTLTGVGFAVRPLRGGARPEPRGRRARAAAHRVGRLERRHEPGGSRGPGRERLAGLVPAHRPGRLRADRGGPR